MATETIKQQAIFPDVPRNPQIVDDRGNITPQWYLFFQNLGQALQVNLKPEGFVIPDQPPANIALLTSTLSIANILYDSTNNVFNGNINNTTAATEDSFTTEQFWLPFAMVTTNPGNPNGVVAGYLTEFCIDITNDILYFCTTAGNAASAVWTAA